MRYAGILLSLLLLLFYANSALALNDLQCIFYNESACPSGLTKILGMTNETGGSENAHAQNWTLGIYNNSLCCNNTNPSITISNTCGTSVVKLSSEDNAHLQTGNETGYSVNVCMQSSSRNLTCSYPTTSCSSNQACLFSLASSEGLNYTNAHMSNCSSYSQKVCCGYSNSAPQMITARIYPALQASDGANLTGYCNATDPDEDQQLYNYKWYKNGVLFYQGVAFKNGSLSMGTGHVCGIRDNDSRIVCWGINTYGALGNGNTTNYTLPNPINDSNEYLSVSAGESFTCGIRSSDSRVLCWGRNNYGQVGNGSTGTQNNNPTLINDVSGYISVSAGITHVCGVRANDSKVLCWGDNFFGSLGNGNYSDQYSPVTINDTNPYLDVQSGLYYSCGVRANDSKVLCWGDNAYGQLGNGSTGLSRSNPDIVANNYSYSFITTGYFHTCGVRANDSKAFCWGRNNYGQLGIGNNSQYTFPAQVNYSGSFSKMTVGYYFTCAINLSDSRVLCWGRNDYGQLGNGSYGNESYNPIYTSDDKSYIHLTTKSYTICGVRANDSRVLCWGSNTYGQLGNGVTGDVFPNPVLTSDTSAYSSISINGYHSCGIRTSDSAGLCWGYNLYGMLGDGTKQDKFDPTLISGGYSYLMLGSGYTHTCGIRNDSRVLCWGSNIYGQLGIGNISNYTTPVLINDSQGYTLISTGGYHTCGIRNDSRVLCWGYNAVYQLGTNNSIQYNQSTLINDTGNYTALSLGIYHSCGLRNDSRVLCWGYNNNGQLGTNNTVYYRVPTLINDTSLYIKISAGALHTCGIRNDSRILCWGNNTYGQLGTNNTVQYNLSTLINDTGLFLEVSSGVYHTCAIRNDSRVFCWGRNNGGQLGIGNTTDYRYPVPISDNSSFKNISSGEMHTCAIRTEDNRVVCWGYNLVGSLGNGRDFTKPQLIEDNSSYAGRFNHSTEISVNQMIHSAYTSLGQNWTLSCQAFDTQPLYSDWMNSSNTTIINTYPTKPVLTYPFDGNNTVFERYLNFSWLASFDQEGDLINYTLNVTCAVASCPAKCTPILFNLTQVNYTSPTPLCFDTYPYNWTVNACDSSGLCNMSNQSNFTIQSWAEFILIVNQTNLGTLSLSQSIKTIDNTSSPLVARNIGNVLLNLTVNSSRLFSSVALNTSYYQYLASDNESNSFAPACSQVSYYNMTNVSTRLLCNMSYVDSNDESRIDFNITVPGSEPPGQKVASLVVTGVSAGW